MASPPSGRTPLQGSALPAHAGEKHVGVPDPNEVIRVTVVLRRATPLDVVAAARRRMPRDEFVAKHGARDDDVDAIRTFVANSGLQVASVDPARRAVVLEGTVAAMQAAFHAKLTLVEYKGQRYRAQVGDLHVPTELEPVIQGVFGLDSRPVAEPRFLIARPADVIGSYSPLDLASLYGFPSDFNGAGQIIAIVELGGGYKQEDLDTYFSGIGLATPTVEAVSIDGGANAPTGDPGGPDGEVMLDIEVAGGIAPAASILVYFAPNSEQGFLDAVSTAVTNPARPASVSISWGTAERNYSANFLTSMDGTLADAAALGVTVCVAAGDNGSSDGQGDGKQHADFPASSPYALACGGTTLNSSNGTSIDSEVVWNDDTGSTGGGVSDVFPLPVWQYDAGVPPTVNPGGFAGRGVPDVAGDASPHTGYKVRVDGTDQVIGGTSAVAPLWAGLVAAMNQYLGVGGVGFLSLVLYGDTSAQQTFNDITSGNNGSYSAKTGWDPCTGWGSPNGNLLLQILGTWVFAQSQMALI